MAMMMLAGCASTNTDTTVKENDKMVAGVATSSNILNAFSDETIERVAELSPNGYYDPAVLGMVGREVGSFELVDINGNTLSGEDLIGKQVVYEVVANWCHYCQQFSSDYMKTVIEQNPDITFVQLFAEGGVDEVKEFYKTVGKDYTKMNAFVIPASETVSQLTSTFEINSYPSFIFVDEEGKIAWKNSGLVTEEDFAKLKELAYGDVKVIDGLKEGVTSDYLTRNEEDVKADLTDEALTRVDELYAEYPEATMTVYSNIGKIIHPDVIYTMKGEKVEWNDLADKKIVYNFISATNEDETLKNTFTNLSAIAANNPGYTFVNVILQYDSTTPTEFIQVNGYDLPGYTIDATYSSTPTALYDLGIYYVPTFVFTEPGGYVAGAIIGEVTDEYFKKAVNEFYGDNAIYKQVKDAE